MAIPTLDQTEGVWMNRTNNCGYHYVNEVFSKDTASERFHRANCSLLIMRGRLKPEHSGHPDLSQAIDDESQRFCCVS